MKPEDFEIFQKLLKETSGLVLTPEKGYLLESRLLPVARKWGVEDLSALAEKIKGIAEPAIADDIIEAMTTNESSFFRDTKPFDAFKDYILPTVMKEKAAEKRIRIWSAACSSGQEPYSLCMILKEKAAELAGWNIEIVATDLSNEILDQAKKGLYTQFEVQRGLPIQYLMQHFEQDGEKWQLKDEIRNMVGFRQFNLLDPYTGLGNFDVIFCRNVLIYFDAETKAATLERMCNIMHKNGILLLGGAETVLGITDSLKPLQSYRGLYVKPDSDLADEVATQAQQTA